MTELGLDDGGALQQLLIYLCTMGIMACLCAMRS